MSNQPRGNRARIMRVGFEPSEPLKNAVHRFGRQSRFSEVVVQTTAFRVIDLGDSETRHTSELETSKASRSLKGMGRSALALASGLEVQQLPQSMRLFFTPDDPRHLKSILRPIETMRSGEMYDRPESALFIDIARAGLRDTSEEDIQRAVAMLDETMTDPDERRGLVIRSPRLVIRDIDRLPRRSQRAA